VTRNGAHGLASRLPVALAILVLVAGCAGNASPTPTPASTPAATSTATPTLSTAPTAAPATTTPPGQMTHGRSTHTATELADGRVLVAGGYFNGNPIPLVDLFTPATGTFSATGPMSVARGFGTATLLANGRVLFAGGDPMAWNYTGRYHASAELYDPTTSMFGPTGSLTTARNLHTATLLLDGRVLITGGSDTFGHAVASAELYDPATGTFAATGSMGGARGFHTATLLLDGRVLIAGGNDQGWGTNPFLATAEIYDPKTGLFKATGSMTVGRSSHVATLLADGRILVTGGYGDDHSGSKSLASAEVYDPTTGLFKATGSMAEGRTYHTATRLVDGRVLVTGGGADGWDYKGPFTASAELYDPKTGTFIPTGPMADTLASHTATLLSDGRVLIAGGYNGSSWTGGGPPWPDVTSAELYDPLTGTFRLVGSGG
jgi:hypothetical protein